MNRNDKIKKIILERLERWDEGRGDHMSNTGCLPDREPDFKIAGFHYWFKEMMMYDCHSDSPFPLRHDDEGGILDFFDYNGDKYWIDCGEEVYEAYKVYHIEQILLA